MGGVFLGPVCALRHGGPDFVSCSVNQGRCGPSPLGWPSVLPPVCTEAKMS